jgi:DNA-binding response OmpR family regulator
MRNPLALIIENDKKLAFIFAQALRLAEFEIEIVQDGSLALARLATITPELVVLDLHLPGLSGRDILQQIRSTPRLAQSRVIVTTADAAMADMVAGEADLALLKPIGPGQLRDFAARLRPLDTVLD